MKKLLVQLSLFSFFLFGSITISAQCGDLVFNSQTDIDTYTGFCTVVNSVLIEDTSPSDPIVDLTPFAGNFATITGDFEIKFCSSLTSLDGLESLDYVGDQFWIATCSSLTDISALDNLQTVDGNFFISSSAVLDIPGINNLSSVGGLFLISNNDNIENIPGFNGLTSTGDFQIVNNGNIGSIAGFTSLTDVSSFFIGTAPLVGGIDGFSNLTTVNGDFTLNTNNGLSDISPFSNLTSVAGDFTIVNCSLLDDCCILTEIEPVVSGTMNLTSNGPNCSVFSDIGTEAPQVICPADTTVGLFEDPSGGCIAEVLIVHPIPTDDCEVVSTELVIIDPNGVLNIIGYNPGSGTTYSLNILGDWTFEFIAYDDLGEGGFCQMIVTVEDTQAPIMTCLPDVTIAQNINCISNFATTHPTVSGCSSIVLDLVIMRPTGVNVTLSNIVPGSTGNFSYFDVGVHTLQYTATNGSGVSTICERIVDVTQGVAFMITCPMDEVISCPSNVSLTVPTFSEDPDDWECTFVTYILNVEDENGNMIINNLNVNEGDVETAMLPQGVNTISYMATSDGLQETSCSYTITVDDSVSPTWNDPSGAITLTGVCGIDDAMALANSAEPTASDNCGAATVSITNTTATTICGASTSTVFTYVAVDGFGNMSAPFTITVILEDTTAPAMSGGISDVTISCNDPFPTVPFITAMDDCAGDLTSAILEDINITTGDCSFGTFAEIHEYIWTVDDGCGNVATEVWMVTIDNDFSVDLGFDMFICSGGSVTLEPTPSGSSYEWSTGETTSTIEVSFTGTYSVTVTSTNGCCSIDDIFVEINSAPDISAVGGQLDCNNESISLLGNSNTSNVSYEWTGPFGFSSSDQNPLVDDPGFYTLTVTDNNGCESTETVEVELLLDNTPPVWDNQTFFATTAGDCGIDDEVTLASSLIPTATDDCGPVTVNLVESIDSNTCGNATTVINYYEAVDVNGNVSPNIFETEIVLVDNDNPILSNVPADLTISCNDAFPATPNMTASDICSGDLTSSIVSTVNVTPGNCTLSTPAEVHSYNWSIDDGCGNTDSKSWTVTVMNDFDISLGEDLLECSSGSVFLQPSVTGSSYLWSTGESSSSINVTISGTYSVTVTSNNGCCAYDDIQVNFSTIPDISAVGGSLDCVNNGVTLQGNSTTANVTYSWQGPNGYTSSDQNPTVFQSGNYTLQVTNNLGCAATQTVSVIPDMDAPDVTVSGGTISCINNEVILMGSSTSASVTYFWTGPGGFTSTDPSPTVDIPGEYILQVSAPNGCVSSGVVQVIDNTQAPDISAAGGTLNCNASSVTLSGSSQTANVTYQWTGPNGYSSTEQNPTVDVGGNYTLQITGSNGCISQMTVEVSSDFVTPNVTAQGGIITCSNPTVVISGASSSPNDIYSWSGPNGFQSNEQSPIVSTVGIYTLTVTASNGCTSNAEAEVTSQDQLPQADIEDSFNCDQESVNLIVITDGANNTIKWSGPNGFESIENEVLISDLGVYTVEVAATNGCTNIATYNLTDIFNFEYVITSSDATQNMGGTAEINITGGTGPFNISWDNETFGEMTSNLAEGIHIVTVEDGLGCIHEFSFEIFMSTSTEDLTEISALKVYPNPATDYVQLEWDRDYFSPTTLRIINLSGKLLKEYEINSDGKAEINASDLECGLYLIVLKNGPSIATSKLVKL